MRSTTAPAPPVRGDSLHDVIVFRGHYNNINRPGDIGVTPNDWGTYNESNFLLDVEALKKEGIDSVVGFSESYLNRLESKKVRH